MDTDKTLFQRHNRSQNEVAEEIDDSLLNKAYEKSIRVANIEIAKRIAMATNSKQGTAKAKKSNKDKDNSIEDDKETEWKAGMPCRAVYTDDGEEYEAFLVRLINDDECIVRYIGYNNSEIVPLSSLKPSNGNNARMKQLEESTKDEPCTAGKWIEVNEAEPMEVNGGVSPSPSDKVRQHKKKLPKKKISKQNLSSDMPHLPNLPNLPSLNTSILKNLGSSDMPMPPPPPPISLSNRSESEEQAISTMLLSWYMTGYYTGLYQGMKRERDNRKN